MKKRTKAVSLTFVTLYAAALAGCMDPLARESTLKLRDQIVTAQRQQLQAVAGAEPKTVQRPPSDLYLEKDPKRIEQLDKFSGPAAYSSTPLDLATGLDGKPSPVVSLSLQQAIKSAVRNNLDVQLANLQPAITQAQLVAAEAVFDAVLFADMSFQKVDHPRTATVLGGFTIGVANQVADTGRLATGIRKPLTTGGQITLQTVNSYNNNKTPGLDVVPDPSWEQSVLLGVTQPLLRGFGEDITRSEIFLSQNAVRREALNLHATLLNTVSETEAAYWQLVLARHNLAIQENLLARMGEARGRVVKRQEFDVSTVQVAQAYAFVERQRGVVIRARQAVRDASDNLKRLLNDPNIPLSDETLIIPSDTPIEQPVGFNLLDAVTTAMRKRPDVRAALLNIDDASIRMSVADNQRLPVLNLNAQIEYFGLDSTWDGGYRALGDGDFIEYLVGGQFETPIGNRAAEANFRASRLQRQASVVQYKLAVQNVVAGVKAALRDVASSYELIGVNRSSRRAAAENLRALIEREETGEALTPEFLLDLKLNTQSRLAEAELAEIQSIIDYNIALARQQQAMGTILEHNQIEFSWPEDMFEDAAMRADPRSRSGPLLRVLDAPSSNTRAGGDFTAPQTGAPAR